MAASNPILTPDRGKAHSVALVLLCTLAVLQMVAMMRAVWLTRSQNGAAKPAALDQDAAGPAGAPPLPSNVPAVVAPLARMAPPSIPASKQAPIKFSAVPPVSAPVVVPAPMMPTPTAASATKAPLDAEMLELIEVAQQLRPLGDLKGALDVLRRADIKSPDHPVVLAEFAQTYELMGLGDKAAAARQKLASLGAAARSYQDTASRPGGSASLPIVPGATLSPATGLTTPDSAALDPSKILGLGACDVIRDRSALRGERVTLRLPIRSQPGAVVDPAAIDIDVFFFDLVNSEKVEQTKADAPVNTWVDAPVDWQDGQERLDVLYSMPEMTEDVIRSIGHRKFHGYIVKLYYKHKLQDTVMEPASLRNFGAASAPQTTGNPLLPPVTR